MSRMERHVHTPEILFVLEGSCYMAVIHQEKISSLGISKRQSF